MITEEEKGKTLFNATVIFQHVIFSHVVVFPQLRKAAALESVGMGALNGNRSTCFFLLSQWTVVFLTEKNYVHDY